MTITLDPLGYSDTPQFKCKKWLFLNAKVFASKGIYGTLLTRTCRSLNDKVKASTGDATSASPLIYMLYLATIYGQSAN